MKFDYKQQPGKFGRRDIGYNNSAKPLMTIVTAYYNAGKYFEQTFNSVMNQTFPWFEWIIVNDGSTDDNDIKKLHILTENEPRIQVVNQKNGGAANARNTGIKKSNTEIIVPLDADDLLAPQYLEYTFWGLYFNPEAAWCYTWSTGFQDLEYLWRFPWDAEKLKTFNFLTLTAAIRKKDLLEVGGYKSEDFLDFEDWRFWLEMLAKHKIPVAVGGYLFWYRRLETGRLSSTKKDPKQQQLAENLIKEISEKADASIKAIEYPLIKTRYPYYQPQNINWNDEYVLTGNRIHILMIIPWMTMGGADKFNLDFVKSIDKEKFDVSVVTTVPSENEWHQKFERYTDKIFHLPDFLDPAHYLNFVGYYIKSRAIDIVFVTNSYVGYYMMPWIRKHFSNVSIIDYVHMEEWYWRAGGHARISGMMGAFVDKTYVCNSMTRNVLVNMFNRNAEKVDTMYIGVDAEQFDRKKVNSGYLYKEYNIDKNREIILFPCRIHPQKRPFMMLDIAEKVYDKNKNVLFVVVGDGEQLEELKNTINCRHLDDVVICVGRSDKMKECYRDAKLTLICSLKEGLALTAYESCSMGVPVISSDVGGQRDLVDSTVGALIPTTQSEYGDLDNRNFNENEIQSFVDAIQNLLENSEQYQECSKNCREKIEKAFSTKKMAENMEKELLHIHNDIELKENHSKQSENMVKLGAFADEVYTLQLLWEKSECEIAEIWNARQFMYDSWENEKRSKEEIIHSNEIEKEQLRKELESIKTLRLYPLVEGYCRFVGENAVGKRIYTLLKKLFGKK